MITFSLLGKNIERINFNKIVTGANMKEYLGYDILEGRGPFGSEGENQEDLG